MKTYNYTLKCKGILNNTLVSIRANSREEADSKALARLETSKLEIKSSRFEFRSEGKMTMAQICGAVRNRHRCATSDESRKGSGNAKH